jgi:hypothetical protein
VTERFQVVTELVGDAPSPGLHTMNSFRPLKNERCRPSTFLRIALAPCFSRWRARRGLCRCGPALNLIHLPAQIPQRPDPAHNLLEGFPGLTGNLGSPGIDRHWTMRGKNPERSIRKATDQPGDQCLIYRDIQMERTYHDGDTV